MGYPPACPWDIPCVSSSLSIGYPMYIPSLHANPLACLWDIPCTFPKLTMGYPMYLPQPVYGISHEHPSAYWWDILLTIYHWLPIRWDIPQTLPTTFMGYPTSTSCNVHGISHDSVIRHILVFTGCLNNCKRVPNHFCVHSWPVQLLFLTKIAWDTFWLNPSSDIARTHAFMER